jgi:hypothetical protein
LKRTYKLQKKPSALKREHPALKTYNFFLSWVIFALLDPNPDSEYGSGSTDVIESGSGTLLVSVSNLMSFAFFVLIRCGCTSKFYPLAPILFYCDDKQIQL